MSLRTRLLATCAVMTAVLLVPAGYGIHRLARLRDIASEQRERHAAAFLATGRLQAALATFDRYARSYIAAPDPALRRGMHRAIAGARAELAHLRAAGYGSVAAATGERIDALAADAVRIEGLVESGRLTQATAHVEAVALRLDEAQDGLERIAGEVDRRSMADIAHAQAISSTAARTAATVTAIALLLALGLAVRTTYALSTPLRRLLDATAAVAGGRFEADPHLPYGQRDELGDLARSFRTMTQRLAELNRVRAEFISMATHDLRTPVSVISGYAQLVEEGILGSITDRQRNALLCIQEQAVILTRLCNQLLDVGRIEAGALGIEPAQIETAALFAAVECGFTALAAREGIDFAVEIDPSVPAMFAADGDRIRDQVLGNLLANAFKFTPRGGRIRVHAWRDGDSLVIDVADTGPGIPGDLLPRVFDKFSQSGEARARGTGLGLAIAKEVVEAHGGRIGVESEPGRGTTFRVALPLTAAGAEPYPPTNARPGGLPAPRLARR